MELMTNTIVEVELFNTVPPEEGYLEDANKKWPNGYFDSSEYYSYESDNNGSNEHAVRS